MSLSLSPRLMWSWMIDTVSARFRFMEKFIIRLGCRNPIRGNIQFTHRIIYMTEMRLQYINLHGTLISIKIFSENWKLCCEHKIRSQRSFNSRMRSCKGLGLRACHLGSSWRLSQRRERIRECIAGLPPTRSQLCSPTIMPLLRQEISLSNCSPLDIPYVLQRIPSTSSLYHLRHYVLLFPRGKCGWENGMRSIQSRSSTKRCCLTASSEASSTRTPDVVES